MALFHFGLENLNIFVFLAILLTVTAIIVLFDISLLSSLSALNSGKMTLLEEHDKSLFDEVE